jgi:hypothetical protein
MLDNHACMQGAHKLYREVPELSAEELGQARLSRGLGSLLEARTSLRLAYAQKMAGLPLTIPEETTAEQREAEAQLHDTHYDTMLSTNHSRYLLETQYETAENSIQLETSPETMSAYKPAAPVCNELYYVSAPDSLGMTLNDSL